MLFASCHQRSSDALITGEKKLLPTTKVQWVPSNVRCSAMPRKKAEGQNLWMHDKGYIWTYKASVDDGI